MSVLQAVASFFSLLEDNHNSMIIITNLIRTTLGMTVACIVKAVLMSTKLNKMVETGIGSPEWAENIIKKVMVVMMMNNVH